MAPSETRDGIIQSCDLPDRDKEMLGRRFTTEERLDIAINYYLCRQESMDYIEIEGAEKMRSYPWDYVEKHFSLIKYGSKEEFRRENLDCCKLIPYPSEQNRYGSRPLFGTPDPGNERANGMGNGMFNFKHKVRYMDEKGTRKEITTSHTVMMVGNCGYPNERIFWDKVER